MPVRLNVLQQIKFTILPLLARFDKSCRCRHKNQQCTRRALSEVSAISEPAQRSKSTCLSTGVGRYLVSQNHLCCCCAKTEHRCEASPEVSHLICDVHSTTTVITGSELLDLWCPVYQDQTGSELLDPWCSVYHDHYHEKSVTWSVMSSLPRPLSPEVSHLICDVQSTTTIIIRSESLDMWCLVYHDHYHQKWVTWSMMSILPPPLSPEVSHLIYDVQSTTVTPVQNRNRQTIWKSLFYVYGTNHCVSLEKQNELNLSWSCRVNGLCVSAWTSLTYRLPYWWFDGRCTSFCVFFMISHCIVMNITYNTCTQSAFLLA